MGPPPAAGLVGHEARSRTRRRTRRGTARDGVLRHRRGSWKRSEPPAQPTPGGYGGRPRRRHCQRDPDRGRQSPEAAGWRCRRGSGPGRPRTGPGRRCSAPCPDCSTWTAPGCSTSTPAPARSAWRRVSRGAAHALLVDSDARAAAVARDNARALGLADRVTVRRDRVERVLAGDAASRTTWSSPTRRTRCPTTSWPRSCARLADGWLAAGAVLAVERSSRGAGPRWPDRVEGLKQRRYGEGTLWYGRFS